MLRWAMREINRPIWPGATERTLTAARKALQAAPRARWCVICLGHGCATFAMV
jgi:hypothetical protein